MKSFAAILIVSAQLAVAAQVPADAGSHWAFQPVANPTVPGLPDSDWVRSPIDAFVLQKLRGAKLAPSPEADRRTLIRRVYYTLTGLPPSPEEVTRFVADTDLHAYERLVNALLESPHYGEHWGRHWLDVARYADTKGYVYAREERFWTHAWAYRDWVVNALNDDLPYNRFLLLQLAADQVKDRKNDDLAAMGFLTLGRRFLGVQREIIDDRIDVVTRGTMALTVSCARCHDHKYDPIPTADYYSLYGIFASSAERKTALGAKPAGDEAFQTELRKRQEKLTTTVATRRRESSDRTRRRIAEYLNAQTELQKYPADGFDQVFSKDDLLPAFVRRWETYLHESRQKRDPVFVLWHAYAALPEKSFREDAVAVTRRLAEAAEGSINPIVAAAFKESPESFEQVVERYGKSFGEIETRWQSLIKTAKNEKQSPPETLPESSAEALRRILHGPGAPCEVPDLPIVHSETFFDSGSLTALWKLQGEVDRWIVNSKIAAPFALTMVDRPQPVASRVFLRGNPLTQGEETPRHFLSLFGTESRKPFQHGSGRMELARAIVDPTNPLTARVAVNRVWMHHFGEGLVTTPSDFGLRAGAPSHPELLDWLTTRFIAEGWSFKKLHRLILLSATFRQSAAGPRDESVRAQAIQFDPDNRLLWRVNQHRLTFEEFRDTMFASAGELDRGAGGKPADMFKPPFLKRRALYGLVDRQYLPGTLRVFDFANPDLHIPQRSETTVPQQALFFMNHPLVLERARALAKAGGESALPKEKTRALFQRAFQRDPTDAEVAESLDLIRAAAATPTSKPPVTAKDWQYGYGTFDEMAERVTGFTALPHFTGAAWQGGPSWPDAKLGWVQLTATGGHPGNDLKHAAVRRWTAPRKMAIEIQSRLVHEPKAGDGIRAFIVSSRTGKLKAETIHQKTVTMNVLSLEVEKGETIDFVVDIGKVLNSDQYLWSAKVLEAAKREGRLAWNSQDDFPKNEINRLTGWEQLAQALLCSNEFLFVD